MPFHGKGSRRDANINTNIVTPNKDGVASPAAQVPNSEVNRAAPSASKESNELLELKRQNKMLELQIKELHSAWDADNESIPSSASSVHGSKPQSSECSDRTSTITSAHDTQHLSLEEGTLPSNNSPPED